MVLRTDTHAVANGQRSPSAISPRSSLVEADANHISQEHLRESSSRTNSGVESSRGEIAGPSSTTPNRSFTQRGSNGQPRQKRSRIAEACASCRSRKTKCDGLHPRCSSCSYLELSCSFEAGCNPVAAGASAVMRASGPRQGQGTASADSMPDIRAYVSGLETRLGELEAKIAMTSQPVPMDTIRGSTYVHNDNVNGWEINDISSARRSGNIESFSDQMYAEPANVYDADRYSSSYTDYTEANSEDGDGRRSYQRRRFEGQSQRQSRQTRGAADSKETYASCPSTAHFTSLVSKTIGMGQQLSTPAPSRRHQQASGHAALQVTLPPPSIAFSLLDFYVQKTHRLYPFVDLTKRRSAYDALYSASLQSASPDKYELGCEIAFYVALFGLTEQVQSSGSRDAVTSQMSLAFLHHLEWRATLTKVQAFLLCAQFYQSLGDVFKAWDVMGLAIRTACSINLHSPQQALPASARERETRSRTWAAIELSDLWFSIMLGRVSFAALAFGRVSEPKLQPGESPSVLTHLRHSSRLTETLGDLIQKPLWIPSRPSCGAMTRIYNRLNLFEVRFDSWQQSLGLVPFEASGGVGVQTVLQLRGCFIRQVAHLPILSMQLAHNHHHRFQETESGLQNLESLRQSSLRALFQSSAKAVDLLISSDAKDSLSSGSYRVFYAFNSLLVLAALHTLPPTSTLDFSARGLAGRSLSEELHQARLAILRLASVRATPWADKALRTADAVLARLGLRTQVRDDANEPTEQPSTSVAYGERGALGRDEDGQTYAETVPLGGFTEQHHLDGEANQGTISPTAPLPQDFDLLAWLETLSSPSAQPSFGLIPPTDQPQATAQRTPATQARGRRQDSIGTVAASPRTWNSFLMQQWQ